MRGHTFRAIIVSLAVAVGGGVLPADAVKEKTAKRVAALILQLGDDDFARREAASKELEALGEPALPALRKAKASDDAEVRRRAERAIRAISRKLARRELDTWQGEWAGSQGQKMTIKGDQWVSSTPTFGPVSGTLAGIEVLGKKTLVDLVVEKGPTRGQTCRAIFRLDGDTLHYCGSYGPARPTEFKNGGVNVYLPWKRVKK